MLIDVPKYLLIFIRVLAILWLVPIFSMRSISALFKVAFAIVTSLLITDFVPYSVVSPSDPYATLLAVLREVLIGLAIGFAIRLLFMAVQATGEIISFQTGFAFARVVDPFSSGQASVLDQFLYMLGVMIFFSVDAHYIVVRGLCASFKELPLGSATFSGGLFDYFITATGRIFSLGLKFGAPLVVALFLIELALGLLSRMIPTMNIFVEGLPVKVFISLSVLSMALGFIAPALTSLFRGMDTEFLRVLRFMR